MGSLSVPYVIDEANCARFLADDASPLYADDGVLVGHVTLRSNGQLGKQGNSTIRLELELTAPELHFAHPTAGTSDSKQAAGNVRVLMDTEYPGACPAADAPLGEATAAADCGTRTVVVEAPVPHRLFKCSAATEFIARNFFLQMEVAVSNKVRMLLTLYPLPASTNRDEIGILPLILTLA